MRQLKLEQVRDHIFQAIPGMYEATRGDGIIGIQFGQLMDLYCEERITATLIDPNAKQLVSETLAGNLGSYIRHNMAHLRPSGKRTMDDYEKGGLAILETFDSAFELEFGPAAYAAPRTPAPQALPKQATLFGKPEA